jgi:hypothetical protein
MSKKKLKKIGLTLVDVLFNLSLMFWFYVILCLLMAM